MAHYVAQTAHLPAIVHAHVHAESAHAETTHAKIATASAKAIHAAQYVIVEAVVVLLIWKVVLLTVGMANVKFALLEN